LNNSFFLSLLTESSKELEELRGAFSRSLDYMKQDVEESRWISLSLFVCVGLSVCSSYYSRSCVTAGFGESGDPSCVIMQIWARIEVSRVTVMTASEQLCSVNCESANIQHSEMSDALKYADKLDATTAECS